MCAGNVGTRPGKTALGSLQSNGVISVLDDEYWSTLFDSLEDAMQCTMNQSGDQLMESQWRKSPRTKAGFVTSAFAFWSAVALRSLLKVFPALIETPPH